MSGILITSGNLPFVSLRGVESRVSRERNRTFPMQRMLRYVRNDIFPRPQLISCYAGTSAEAK